MNLIEFSKILYNPNLITKEGTDSLENILKEFPYFQAARVLHLSALKKQSSFKYNAALKKTAAFTTDRSILFDFITTDGFVIENYTVKKDIKVQEKLLTEKNTGKKRSEKKKTTTEALLSHNHKDSSSHKKQENILIPGKPINFKKDDSFSFNEWLNLTVMTPVRDTADGNKTEQKSNEKEDLINKFIRTNPKIKPSKSPDVIDYSTFGSIENENLMTETLAHVYLEQKKYSKAITAFRILSLKYPEKSSFFANRIEEIEKIQKNKS